MKALASHTDNLARVNSLEGRARSNLGSDGRSTRESESSEGSGELRHDSVQTTTIYESLAAELRAKLGKYFFENTFPPPSSNYRNYLNLFKLPLVSKPQETKPQLRSRVAKLKFSSFVPCDCKTPEASNNLLNYKMACFCLVKDRTKRKDKYRRIDKYRKCKWKKEFRQLADNLVETLREDDERETRGSFLF